MIINNLKSIKNSTLNFSNGINIFIGPNNSGKSTILLPILSLQEGLPDVSSQDLRLGENNGSVNLDLIDKTGRKLRLRINITGKATGLSQIQQDNRSARFDKFKNNLDKCNIFPLLSNRKTKDLLEQINITNSKTVFPNLKNLYNKIDGLSDYNEPLSKKFAEICNNILDFKITSEVSLDGKKSFFRYANHRISIIDMGDGIISILGFISYLLIAENKIFIIEEIENDIHPQALKSLIDLIIEKSNNNQFIITTHSNIVLTQLGKVANSKIFEVDINFNELPLTNIKKIENVPEEKIRILETLGYSFLDYNLYAGWLILEESSAEKIIREYLIKWFFPNLSTKLRTFSSRSKDNIKNRFDNLNVLIVFIHLTEAYKNKIWVMIDNGKEELKILDEIKQKYIKNGWNEENFIQLKYHDFELYYPERFQDDVKDILAITDRKKKYYKKIELLKSVENWIASVKENQAKNEFQKSANEIIQYLKLIDSKLN
jgi:predicted ATPase